MITPQNRYCPRPTLQVLQTLIRAAGFQNYAGDWENEERLYAFSREQQPGTFGDSKLTIGWVDGWLFFQRAVQIPAFVGFQEHKS